MKLLYATANQYPSILANRLQVKLMSQALAKQLGTDFTLGVNEFKEAHNFVPKIKVFGGWTKSPYLALRYLRFASHQHFTHIYCREAKLLFFMQLFSRLFSRRFVFVYEAHYFSTDFYYRHISAWADRVVVIASSIRGQLIKTGIAPTKILVAPDGVDLKQFTIPDSATDCRRQCHLPTDKFIALYAGHLYDWKGAWVLAETAKLLPDNFMVVFVGGTSEDLDRFKTKYGGIDKLKILGWKDHNEMPYLLKAADVLVLPNAKPTMPFAEYTSPMKLFEYLASGTPIVASDLPSLREILSNQNSILFPPEDFTALATNLKQLQQDKNLGKTLAKQALTDAKEYDWDRRAARIIAFIRSL